MILGKEQYKKYLNNFLSDDNSYSFENFNLQIEDDEDYIINQKCYASVIFLDMVDFSKKIQNCEAEVVKLCLMEFYKQVFPVIDKFGGRIDRVMGDGIIAVFYDYDIFDELCYDNDDAFNNNADDIFLNAYNCCKEIICNLRGSFYESKAAIGSGMLYFCEISSEHYSEVTCIGKPLTIVHRLENEADKNQILMLEDIPEKQVVKSKSKNIYKIVCEFVKSQPKWSFHRNICKELKGLGNIKINIAELK